MTVNDTQRLMPLRTITARLSDSGSRSDKTKIRRGEAE
jgi:hypothetical protein